MYRFDRHWSLVDYDYDHVSIHDSLQEHCNPLLQMEAVYRQSDL